MTDSPHHAAINAIPPDPVAAEPLPLDNVLEADVNYDDDDSTYGGGDARSETTSVTSSIYRGYTENGRTYQSTRAVEYYMPTDEKQWEAMQANHLLYLILDSQQSNPLFRSPISKDAQHIIDLGTGDAAWAIDVAERRPNAIIHGVDLYPPPEVWVPPNCFLEVDDISKPWIYSHKFDLVHMRNLIGALNVRDWEKLYRRIYDNLEPGGWIEQVECDIALESDDDTLPADAMIATKNFREMFVRLAAKADRPLDDYYQMRGRIEAAGFVNVQQQDYKQPIGAWPRDEVFKDAGRVNKISWKKGVEGWVMWLLTRFGEPEPWSEEEVAVYLAKIRNEIDQGWHIYQKARRVWAQKPFGTEESATVAGV